MREITTCIPRNCQKTRSAHELARDAFILLLTCLLASRFPSHPFLLTNGRGMPQLCAGQLVVDKQWCKSSRILPTRPDDAISAEFRGLGRLRSQVLREPCASAQTEVVCDHKHPNGLNAGQELTAARPTKPAAPRGRAPRRADRPPAAAQAETRTPGRRRGLLECQESP